MEFYGFDKTRAIANCDSLALGSGAHDTATLSGWNRVRPEHVIELLDRAAPDARGDARNLAALLARFPWRIRPAVQAQSGGARLVSNAREVTVSAAARTFQLHCTENPSLKLERITA